MTTHATAGSEGTRPLSPITRRIFLLASTPVAVAGAAALTGCGGGGGYADCIYCDAAGQDYEECDSDYCNYYDEQ